MDSCREAREESGFGEIGANAENEMKSLDGSKKVRFYKIIK